MAFRPKINPKASAPAAKSSTWTVRIFQKIEQVAERREPEPVGVEINAAGGQNERHEEGAEQKEAPDNLRTVRARAPGRTPTQGWEGLHLRRILAEVPAAPCTEFVKMVVDSDSAIRPRARSSQYGGMSRNSCWVYQHGPIPLSQRHHEAGSEGRSFAAQATFFSIRTTPGRWPPMRGCGGRTLGCGLRCREPRGRLVHPRFPIRSRLVSTSRDLQRRQPSIVTPGRKRAESLKKRRVPNDVHPLRRRRWGESPDMRSTRAVSRAAPSANRTLQDACSGD